MYYFCIIEGAADCLPVTQTYHSAATREEMEIIVSEAATEFTEWQREEEGKDVILYKHTLPAPGENNYSFRPVIAKDADWVMDVIGMTAEDYAIESEGEDR